MAERQKIILAGMTFDALLNQTAGYEAESPDYVVESGFTIGDSIILKSEMLDVTLFVTEMAPTGHIGKDMDVAASLKELYYSKTLISVTTSIGDYTDMAIQKININRTNDGKGTLEISISLKHIRITETQTTSIPDSYGKSGKTEKASGTASTKAVSSGDSSGSAANNDSNSSSGTASASSGGNGGGGGSAGSNGSVLYNLASKVGLF